MLRLERELYILLEQGWAPDSSGPHRKQWTDQVGSTDHADDSSTMLLTYAQAVRAFSWPLGGQKSIKFLQVKAAHSASQLTEHLLILETAIRPIALQSSWDPAQASRRRVEG